MFMLIFKKGTENDNDHSKKELDQLRVDYRVLQKELDHYIRESKDRDNKAISGNTQNEVYVESFLNIY
jgi:hypothetical protein